MRKGLIYIRYVQPFTHKHYISHMNISAVWVIYNVDYIYLLRLR